MLTNPEKKANRNFLSSAFIDINCFIELAMGTGIPNASIEDHNL